MKKQRGPERKEVQAPTRRALLKTSVASALGATALLSSSLISRSARADTCEVALYPRYYPTDAPLAPLTGKLVVITGASRGNGRATGLALHQLGATVIGTSRNVA